VLVDHLCTGGRYLPHGAASGAFGAVDAEAAAARAITIVPLWSIGGPPQAMYDFAEQAIAMAAWGELIPTIGQTFPLARVADAHAAIEARAVIGKTLLVVE
jgi:NADPH2:quinone reductase